jgi:hypothetical protein
LWRAPLTRIASEDAIRPLPASGERCTEFAAGNREKSLRDN